ncbi:hypothetical protein D3C76_1365370 [compost metagenome]
MDFLVQDFLNCFISVVPGSDACPAVHQNRFNLGVADGLKQQLLHIRFIILDHLVSSHGVAGFLQQLADAMPAFVGIGGTGIGQGKNHTPDAGRSLPAVNLDGVLHFVCSLHFLEVTSPVSGKYKCNIERLD